MFFTKLKSLYPTLTYSETKIADYILANKDDTFDMTSQELAGLLGISQSTACLLYTSALRQNFRSTRKLTAWYSFSLLQYLSVLK